MSLDVAFAKLFWLDFDELGIYKWKVPLFRPSGGLGGEG